jgi:ribokinase
MQEYDIITIGDMCVDLLVELGGAEPCFGQVEQWIGGYTLEMGGSACIFACQAARLGLRVAVLGRVGPDPFGDLALRRLAECGVDTRFVTVDPALKTGLGIALCRDCGDRAILTYGGSISALRPADVTDEFLRAGRHLHYASYYLQTGLLPGASALLRRARALGLTLSLDTNWDPQGSFGQGLDEALGLVDLIFPNQEEALAMARASDVAVAAAALAALGPLVAVKLGAGGALVHHGNHHLHVPVSAIVLEPVDTVGAGDCFAAGFLAAWLRGAGVETCAHVGNCCGRASTLARGGVAGQLLRSQVPELA